MPRCPSCDAANPEDSRFCNRCGSAIEPADPAGSRKVVTVVFCDVVGSTAMGEALDPEALRGVMSRYFDAMRAAIERHGGTVEKFIGDAVMAVFGVPVLREDDALRAVRAAADMRTAAEELTAELARTHGIAFDVRIGVNTGEVVAGSGDQTIVTGDPVNVAARLEQAAGPGEILIGERTATLVRDAVTLEQTDALDLKGKSAPVAAFRLGDIDPTAAGFARHLDAPMVGRTRELALLGAAFERTVSDHACQLFTVLGVGGVGKSRLLAAFVGELEGRATVLRGRCLPYGEGITFWPLAEALIEVAGLVEADSPDDARAKLAGLVGGGDDLAVRIADRVGQAIGIPGSETAAEETLWAVRLLLERLAAEEPVVFVIDDLQWAEPKLLELIEYVADRSRDASILLACMARPELLEARPDWGGGKLNSTSILLEPLTPEDCRRLVANLLADDDVDERVRDRIASAAEGHPLFAEEMTALLVDEGRLVLKDGAWVATGDLADVPVPPTIAALLSARLDRLPADEREVIGVASVMGQVFYTEALTHLAGRDRSGHAIGALVRKQFVRPERSDLAATEAMAFRHLLIRDTAYDALPKAERADLHERFAAWLIDVMGAAAEQDEVLGYHLEQAWRYRAELGATEEVVRGLATSAAAHLARAGSRARDRFDSPAIVNLLGRAVALIQPDDLSRVELLMHLGMATRDLGSLAEAGGLLEEAERAAERIGDEVLLGKARIVRAKWGHDLSSGRRIYGSDIAEIASELIPVFEAHGDDAALGQAWGALGDARWFRSRAADAADAWARAADHFRLAGDRREELHTLAWLVSAPILGPQPVPDAFEAADAILERVRGSVEAETSVLDTRAWLLVMTGRLDEARAVMQERRRTMHELGSREMLAFESQSLGWLEIVAGRFDEAERIFGGALEALKAMRSQTALIVAAFRAQALYRLGRLAEASDDAAFALRNEDAGLSGDVMAKGVLARVAATEGRVEEALAMQRDAIEVIDTSDFTNDRADARMDLSEILELVELAGRRAEATVAAADALALFEEKGNTFQATSARERIDHLSS